MSFLQKLLKPQQLTKIVDIGANPIDGDPPYKIMLENQLCQLIGFEPQQDALAQLLRQKSALETYLPYVVGDGSLQQLNVCKGSGMTSLYEPNFDVLNLFGVLAPLAEVVEKIPLQTIRLDDISEVEHIDFLKIDIQGGELAVFQSGRTKLKDTVVIQTEVSFMTLYHDQAGFGEIDIELRAQGFVPHCFAAVKHWPISPMVLNHNPRQALNQLLEADVVYVRDFSKPDLMTDEQLKQLAMIMHIVYGSYDLALRCLMLLEQRQGWAKGSLQEQYLKSFNQG